MLRPVSRASSSRPLAVAARWSRWRTCVTPARGERRRVCLRRCPRSRRSSPRPSPLPARATLSARRPRARATRRAGEEGRRYHPLSAEEMHVSRSSVCRCMLAVLAALARAARPLGSLQDHRGGTFVTLATSNGGHGRSAGQCDAAVLAAVPGHAGRPDGVPQVLGPVRQQRGRRSGGEAAAHDRRGTHLDAHVAARRPLLERRARAAGRRALHVRAAVQGARPDRASRSTA